MRRELGVSEATLYARKKEYAGMGVGGLRQLRQENRRLNGMVADLSPDEHILQEVLKEKGLKPTRQRALVDEVCEAYRLGVRRACGLLCLNTSTYDYRGRGRHRGEKFSLANDPERIHCHRAFTPHNQLPHQG